MDSLKSIFFGEGSQSFNQTPKRCKTLRLYMLALRSLGVMILETYTLERPVLDANLGSAP